MLFSNVLPVSAKRLQSVAKFKRFMKNNILNCHSVTGILIKDIEQLLEYLIRSISPAHYYVDKSCLSIYSYDLYDFTNTVYPVIFSEFLGSLGSDVFKCIP